jgi:hypothetical protein
MKRQKTMFQNFIFLPFNNKTKMESQERKTPTLKEVVEDLPRYGVKIYHTKTPYAAFYADEGELKRMKDNFNKSGYKMAGEPFKIKSSTGGSFQGGASHQWMVKLEGEGNEDVELVLERVPAGEEPVVVYRTETKLNNDELLASPHGTVAIHYEGEHDPRVLGGYDTTNQQAWVGEWPNHVEDNDEDQTGPSEEEREAFKKAVQEAEDLSGELAPKTAALKEYSAPKIGDTISDEVKRKLKKIEGGNENHTIT